MSATRDYYREAFVMLDEISKDSEKQMKKALEALESDFRQVRTGRANPHVLDKVVVDCYGMTMPLNQVGLVTVPDPHTIQIQPFDINNLPNIVKAVQTADIGLTPQNDGRVVRLNVPPLNEERRREIVKGLKKRGEECKVSIRNIRRDANDLLKLAEKDSEITEDDLQLGLTRIQELTDTYSKKCDEAVSEKEEEVMTV
jgi:ribosome recycling factor